MINYKELFIMAGLIAAQQWEIDIKDVEIMFTDTPDTISVAKLSHDHIDVPDIASSRRVTDVIEFEHWRKPDQYDIWLGYSDVTNTLVICTQQNREWLKRV